jgi:hypothetical protein
MPPFAAQRLLAAMPCARSSKQIAEKIELDGIQTHHWNVIGCSAVTRDQLLEEMCK